MNNGILYIKCWLLICVAVGAASAVAAAEGARMGVGVWNVGAVYDTVPSRFYNDRAYTPEGARAWNTRSYQAKVEAVAQVVDSMNLPLVALYGLENEAVVRDVVRRCAGDYAYVHLTQDAWNGLDFALLYRADVFFPNRTYADRYALSVEGVMCGRDVVVVMSHSRRDAGFIVAGYRDEQPERCVICVGRVTEKCVREAALVSAMSAARARGEGEYVWRGRWVFDYDIAIDERLTSGQECRGGVFLPDFIYRNVRVGVGYDSNRDKFGLFGSRLPLYAYF